VRSCGIANCRALHLLLNQLLGTLGIADGLLILRLSLGNLSLRSFKLCLIRRRIDLEQHFAGLHLGAFNEITMQQDAAHAGANLHIAIGADARCIFIGNGHVVRSDRHDLNLRRRCACRCLCKNRLPCKNKKSGSRRKKPDRTMDGHDGCCPCCRPRDAH
jgi:hypothetical protein